MARRLLAASAVALLALPAAFAGEDAEEGDELDFPALARKILSGFPAFDADADGKVTAAELPFEDLFVVLDRDKDGSLTKEEIAKALQAMDADAPAPKGDGDGKRGPMPAKPAAPEGEEFLARAKERVAVDPRFNPETRRTQFLAGFDRDPKDGKIQKKEYQSADAEKVFRDFDMDKDGALDERELLYLMKDQVHDLGRQRRRPNRYNFLVLFDLDDDRSVTRLEYAFLRGPASAFKSLDEDGDGVVTYEEIAYLNTRDKRFRGKGGERPTEAPAETRTLWDLYDKDKDGRVTAEEFGGGEAVFRRLDRNRDGYLTLADG